jgi:acyl transferase domain-containing protein/phosphopantetheinyl transferase
MTDGAHHSRSVAIVGMACIFPDAPDLATYWHNLRRGHDAITEVPSDRWEPLYYDPSSGAVDRLYCHRGGFIGDHAQFEPTAFGIMPVAAAAAEPDQLLTLKVAAQALEDAGYSPSGLADLNAGIVLGRGGYLNVGTTRLLQRVRGAEQLVSALRTLVPGLPDDQLERIKAAFQDGVPEIGPATAIGLVPNLAASRVANRLDLRGPAYTVDAACASSLLAVDQACDALTSGRCDVMLAGGVHLTHDTTFWSVFCQLGAMSRDQMIRPFDERADGLLIGEGVGVVVLRRLADAERDGDRIYAVVRGVGVSSDGRTASLMEPSVEGQLVALDRAWKAAELTPDKVGLVEAHGTGTAVGDEAELETLRRFFGPPAADARPGLGSVKSMIGHTMPAAGIAGIIKAALAVHHGVKPPTLHADRPHPTLADSRFRLLQETEPWTEPHRVAAVNAFGFGGINAHVILSGHQGATTAAAPRATTTTGSAPRAATKAEILTLAAATPAELLEALDSGLDHFTGAGSGSARLAILNPDPDKIARAKKIIGRGKRWPGRGGVWFSPDGVVGRGGRVAFLFPGVDASFRPQVQDVAAHFDLPVPAHLNADGLEEIGLGIVEVSRLMHEVLGRVGIRAEAMAGHSIGEWTAMICSGMIPHLEIDALIAELQVGTLEVPGVAFAALGCGHERAEQVIGGLPAIAVSHDNCPHQVLVCGKDKSVRLVTERLKSEGVLCQVLPFRSGFHSPLFTDYVGMHKTHFARLPMVRPEVPVWSATTCAPFPGDPDEIRALVLRHLVRPVRFRELVDALYAEGFRAFVQVGSGSLVGFVSDTLKGREHLAITANAPAHTGLEQLRRLAAALWVEGGHVDLAPLFDAPEHAALELKLPLGAPLVRLPASLTIDAGPSFTDDEYPPGAGPVWDELNALTREMDDTRRAVMKALVDSADHRAPHTSRLTLSVHTVQDLWDHTFFDQPRGWTNPADLHPVVPMTMLIRLMMDAAEQVVPGRVAVAVRDVEAFKWLVVEPEREVEITARPLPPNPDGDGDGDNDSDSDNDRVIVQVSLDEFARAEVVLAQDYLAPPPPRPLGLAQPAPSPIDAHTLYADRWMFHGPRYQGMVELGPIGDEGIHGVIVAPPGPGALLDNAGQLFGYWVMARQDMDRLAMPQRIGRLDFYGPEPSTGERLDCDVWIRLVEDTEVISDLQLTHQGALWCAIEGWSDYRFETDQRMWDVMLQSSVHLLAEPTDAGYLLYDDRKRRTPTRDWLSRRYLSQAERQTMRDAGPRRARSWLHGRIAAKDAVRHWLWQHHDHPRDNPIFPIEVRLEYDADGAPTVHAPTNADLRISLAHSGDVAVALVREGSNPGIDVEKIAPRDADFLDVAFTDRERALLPPSDPTGEHATRFWCAKEAVAKARRKGLGGNPKRYAITETQGPRLRANALWVQTQIINDHIIAWTEGT